MQPGENDPHRFVSIAATPERDFVLAYLPCGGEIELAVTDREFRWFDPRNGNDSPAAASLKGTYMAPDGQDWVLVFGSTSIGLK